MAPRTPASSSYGSINQSEDELRRNTAQNHRTNPLTNGERRPSSLLQQSPNTLRLLFAAVVVVVGISVFALSRANHVNVNAPTILGRKQATMLIRTSIHTEQQIPFPATDRTEYSSLAASDIVDPQLFDPSFLRTSSASSSDKNGMLTVPFPTGAFWTNLVLTQSTSDQGMSYPIMAYPYGYRWSATKVQVSYPPLRRLMDPISIRDIFNPDLTLGVLESTKERHVTAFDPLSVTLRYSSSSGIDGGANSSYWETYLVQGSPYVTMACEKTTPVLTALSIFSSFTCGNKQDCSERTDKDDGTASTTPMNTLRGTTFRITTQENLTWLLFASDTITLSYDTIHKTTVTSNNQFTGVLRLVLLPPALDYDNPSYASQFSRNYPAVNITTKVEERLACHANVYPVGCNISWKFDEKDVATVNFRFQTKQLSKKESSCSKYQLLMLALPHHVQVLSSKSLKPTDYLGELTFRSIKGKMAPVQGSVWTYDEPLTTIGFDSASTLKNAASLDDNTKRIILDQVNDDMSRVLPTLDENVYGFGKQIARLAQLAHIASVLEPKKKGGEKPSLTETITEVLHQYLSAFLLGQNKDKLLYDTVFGGIVSQNGLTDSMDDFGNGRYNDHLFHYGYVLYASAVLGKLNSTFVEEQRDAIDALLLDVANSHNADSQMHPDRSSLHGMFPFTRHKSWFDSHSFASGLFPFADGKSLESSGESVNFYYGAYLWTKVSTAYAKHSTNEEVDFVRLLLAMEMRGVKTYWHMVTDPEKKNSYHTSDIYNPLFAKNLMVGNVGMMDVTIATWFGIEPLYVHMINFLPVTAITSELFDKSYVNKEFQQIIQPIYENVEMAWKGYVICDRALLDPTAAWEDALNLRSYELDQAISKSQVLYFAGTRNEFVAHETWDKYSKETKHDYNNTATSLGSASCSEHKACAALGLTGNCCPAPNGDFLECCGSATTSQKGGGDSKTSAETRSESSAGSSASCTQNKACAEQGLTGYCCPTLEGNSLDCCE